MRKINTQVAGQYVTCDTYISMRFGRLHVKLLVVVTCGEKLGLVVGYEGEHLFFYFIELSYLNFILQ